VSLGCLDFLPARLPSQRMLGKQAGCVGLASTHGLTGTPLKLRWSVAATMEAWAERTPLHQWRLARFPAHTAWAVQRANARAKSLDLPLPASIRSVCLRRPEYTTAPS
jgi:hypothetical protein